MVMCNKVRYRSRAQAERALSAVRRLGERGAKKPTRSYPCPQCHGWHLTSDAN